MREKTLGATALIASSAQAPPAHLKAGSSGVSR
jgi:hypothetical protein